MAAPQYGFTNYFGTSDPAGDILTLIENQLTNTEWVFVEQVSFTQSATARVMRVWKNPSTLNAAGVDFYIGLVKNAVAGIYLAFRSFEGWNTTTKTMQRPCLGGTNNFIANWSAIAYGNSTYVAVANGTTTSTAATSPDGINWTSRLMPTTAFSWTGVAYGGTTFVAVATGTNIAATSPDGITWTARTLPSTANWTGVYYGGGLFVAFVNGTTTAATSPDGITWTTRTLPSASAWTAGTYGGGTHVIISASSGVAATSTDGASWTSRTFPANTFGSIAYGNGTFVAIATVNSTNAAATSPNGTTWTTQTLPITQVWGPIAFGNGSFTVVGGTGASVSATTTDGVTWTQRTGVGATAMTFGTLFATVSAVASAAGASSYSTDGITFTIGKGMGLVSSVALGDYAPSAVTLPPMADSGPTLTATTNYDVAVLASKSYLAVGINANGTGTVVLARIVGLYSPAYSDSQVSNPPLMNLDLRLGANSAATGVSRSMRVPIDANGTSTFAIGAGPESLLVGSFSGGLKEPVTQSIRGSRVALVASSGNTTGFTLTGGMRGWLYDCTAVATSTATALKIADTVTIGATVWTAFGSSTTTANTGITNQPVGYFFNVLAGS